MASLLVLKGGTPNQRISLDKDRTVLGRNADCGVVINVPAVSREHACILRVQGTFYLEDLGSRNGTFLNNQQVTSRLQLKDNDKIKICDFLCSFHDATRKPLPPANEEEDDEPEDSSTVEAQVSHSSGLVLESQSAEKLRALLEISSKLSRTLELGDLLPKIVDRLFELFKQADRGFIILREEATTKLIPKVIKTRRPQDESNARFSRSIVKQCMETTQAFLSDDASADSRFALSQSIADFRIRSVMCAPLCGQDGKAFGVIQLDTQDRSKKFTEDDLKLLVGVANQASVALENAKLHEDLVARERLKRDLELAKEVQTSFLPKHLPTVGGYEFFAHYEPAQEVGGDYYGFVPLPPSRLAITLGDVAGKGVPAALLMAKLSSDTRFCTLTEPDPGLAIGKLNDLLCQSASDMDRFVTMAAAVLDSGEHVVTVVNAGHPPPMVYRHTTGKLEESTSHDIVGLPLGIAEGMKYDSAQVRLYPGDCLLIFSDGVTEAWNKQNEQFGMKGIYDALRQGGPINPRILGERIIRLVKLHAAGRSQHDDITLVCFGRTLNGEGSVVDDVLTPAATQ